MLNYTFPCCFSSIFAYLLNSDAIILSHTVFLQQYSRGVSNFEFSPELNESDKRDYAFLVSLQEQ